MEKKVSETEFIIEMMMDSGFVETMMNVDELDEGKCDLLDITKMSVDNVLEKVGYLCASTDDEDTARRMDALELVYGKFGVLFISTCADILGQKVAELQKCDKSDLVITTFAMHKGLI